jgi:tetratricopeptide (TPR) repeat protein
LNLTHRIALLALVACILGGCATLGEFELLENRVATLELERKRLKAEMAEDVNRLENLHGQLTKAEETLRRSGANLGIRMEQVENELPHLRGQMEAATFQLAAATKTLDVMRREMFDRVGATSLYLPGELPKTADGMWTLCEASLKAGKTRQARAALDHFEASYPKDPRADDALMRLARQAEGEGDITRAVKVYQQIHDRYPDGDQVTGALWRIGELLDNRGDCKRAMDIFGYLSRAYKDSDVAPKAEAKAAALAESCQQQ